MFRNDPFFMDPFEHMDRVMSSFPSPLFESPFEMMHRPNRMLQIDDGLGRSNHHSLHGFPPSPFGGMLESMSGMNSMMRNMQRNMMVPSFPSMGSGSHSFQSSTVIMSNDVNGPRVIQSSSSSRVGADGVKETRRSHKDSATGEMRMAIGHHINERAHIMEKSENRQTGEKEENQEYVNIDEDEADSFNNEWMQKMQPGSSQRHRHHRSVAYHHPGASRHGPYERHSNQRRRRAQTAAITYRPHTGEEDSRDQFPTTRDDLN